MDFQPVPERLADDAGVILMGGNNDATNQENSIAQQQIGIAQQANTLSQQQMAQRQALQAPAIDQLTKIISGDKNALTSATSVPIGQLAKSAQATKENIYDQIPAGAGRDVALAQNTMNKNTGVASFLNDTYMKAFPALAQMGSESGNVGLQALGGSENAFSGASSTTGQVMQADSANKASTMGLLGSLAGAGGMAAMGKSDARLKENVETLDGTLDKLDSIRGVHFDFIGENPRPGGNIGVIAQEVLEVFPELVTTDPYDGMYRVDYGALSAVAIQAVKELHQQVKALQERLTALEVR
jgi:hypothetical protein